MQSSGAFGALYDRFRAPAVTPSGPVVQPVTATKVSAGELRIRIPVQSTLSTDKAEYRMKTCVTGSAPAPAQQMWSIQGVYAVPPTGPMIQLSDSTDSSVLEYACQVGDDAGGAPVGSYDFFGLLHGNETRQSMTVTLDGVDISSLANGSVVAGVSLVFTQTSNMLLPLLVNGTFDGVTVVGSGTLKHTFTSEGVLVEHSHAMNAGYKARTWYAAMLPVNFANFNRVQPIGQAPYIMLGNESVQYGVQSAGFQAWHTTAHRYRYTLTLPSGGPDLAGQWTGRANGTTSAPDLLWYFDHLAYGKCYVMYQGSDFSLRVNIPASSHKQRYTVSMS